MFSNIIILLTTQGFHSSTAVRIGLARKKSWQLKTSFTAWVGQKSMTVLIPNIQNKGVPVLAKTVLLCNNSFSFQAIVNQIFCTTITTINTRPSFNSQSFLRNCSYQAAEPGPEYYQLTRSLYASLYSEHCCIFMAVTGGGLEGHACMKKCKKLTWITCFSYSQ